MSIKRYPGGGLVLPGSLTDGTAQLAVGRVSATNGFVGKLVAGPVSDASFTVTPPDGTFATDSTAGRIYQRIGGVWKFVALLGANVAVPASIAGLHCWFDFSQSLLSDGAAITSWQDLSGNSRHMAVPSGMTAPTWKASIQNGKGVARFDGTTTSLETANFASALTQPFTVFAVFRASLGTTASEPVFSNSGGTPSLNAFNTGLYGINTGTPGFRVVSGGAKQNQLAQITAVFGGTGTSLVRQNGVQVNSATDTATATLTKLRFGQASGPQALNGDIAEVILYSGALSLSDIQTVEGYLA